MASSTMTLSASDEAVKCLPEAPHPCSVTSNNSSKSFSKVSSLSRKLFQPLRSQRALARQRDSYWSTLGHQQRQRCVDYGGKRLFGDKIGWWPSGCVLQRWQDELFPMITRIQNEEGNGKWIFKGCKRHPTCTIELWMVDHREGIVDSALPTIVARCSDIRIAKRTLFVLQKIPSFIDLELGFEFLPWREDISLVSGSGEDEISDVDSIDQWGLLGGSKIFISSTPISKLKPWKQATLGGVLLLNNQYYGLTVAHAFFKEDKEDPGTELNGSDEEFDEQTDEHSDGQSDRQSDDHSDEQSDRTSDWDSDFDAFHQTQSRGPPTVEDEHHDLWRLLPSESNVVYSGHFDHELAASQIFARQIPNFLSNLSLLGYLPTTRQASDANTSRAVRSDATKWISMQGDWALVRIHDPRYFTPNRFITPDGAIIVPSRTSESPPRGKVFLATNNGKLRPSYCSGVKMGLFLSHSVRMKETWALDTQCSPGDCGTWVLDAESKGVLHGIIAASSKVNNISYILPASNIFDDIKASWKAEVQHSDCLLPTANIGFPMLDFEDDVPTLLDNDPGAKISTPTHHPASLTEKDAFRDSSLPDCVMPLPSFELSSISPPALSDSSAASTIGDMEDIAFQQHTAEAGEVLIGLDMFESLISPKDALTESEVCLFKLVAFDET